jgi:hypothetical protein
VGILSPVASTQQQQEPFPTLESHAFDVPIGTKIEARYKGGPRFFPGVVAAVNKDASGNIETLSIRYDDGENETGVPRLRVRCSLFLSVVCLWSLHRNSNTRAHS